MFFAFHCRINELIDRSDDLFQPIGSAELNATINRDINLAIEAHAEAKERRRKEVEKRRRKEAEKRRKEAEKRRRQKEAEERRRRREASQVCRNWTGVVGSCRFGDTCRYLHPSGNTTCRNCGRRYQSHNAFDSCPYCGF